MDKKLKFVTQYRRALTEMLNDITSQETITLLKAFCLNDNYYGDKDAYILFGRKKIEVETIWYDDTSAYVHVSCIDFETDIEINRLSDRNIRRVMKLVYNRYMSNLKEGVYNG